MVNTNKKMDQMSNVFDSSDFKFLKLINYINVD